MAVQMRGYYGIGTAKKDFGFSSNMTLPLSGGYSIAQPGGMPQEAHSGKGHASFAVEKEGRADQKKSKSWKNRLSGFFKKDKKKEEETVETTAASSKVKTRPEESSLPENTASDKAAAPEDEVNARILAQEGLETVEDEEEVPHEESPLGDDDDDMVVAQEVDVVYFDKESGDEDIPQTSLLDVQEAEEDLPSDGQPQPDKAEVEQYDKELARVESDRATYPMIPSDKKDSDQDDTKQQNIESKSAEKTSSKQKKKKKTENRRSTALEVNSQAQEEGKKNGKTKKQRPKSMPAAPPAMANERQMSQDELVTATDKIVKPTSKVKQHNEYGSTPPDSTPSEGSQKAKSKKQLKATSTNIIDTGAQEAAALNEAQPEIKKPKEKKTKAKNTVALNETEAKGSTESPPTKKKNTKVKNKRTASEETFNSPILSASPPPEEEIRVPTQVTVGVIKRKKSRTRPLLEVKEAARSEAYRSGPDSQAQGEDDIDAEERELLHDMDTLQLMAAEGVAEVDGKKAKKKKQDKAHDTQVNVDKIPPAKTKVSPKATKKSKSKENPPAESEPVISQSHASAESREPKASKKTKHKAEQPPETVAQQPPQLETATELDKKQVKKVKKTKSKGKSELEAEVVIQVPPQPETLTEPEKKQSKRVKKAKGKEKIEVEPEPVVQSPPKTEEATKVNKKESKKAKKVKSEQKSEPTPEPEIQPLPQNTPKDVPEDKKKKKVSKMVKGKGKTEDTDTALRTPAKAAVSAGDGSLEDVKPKKTKKKLSKSSIVSSDSPSLHQNSPAIRGSKSKLATKESTSKIASEESDDLIWIGADKLSRKKKSSIVSKDDTAVGEEPEVVELSPSSRSTSYHELSKEDRKTFQEELRKASSQHSVDSSHGAEGNNIKVEIDPNVKVTKSGVVKGGKGSRRPSLQMDLGGGYRQTDSESQSEDQGSGGRSKKISLDLSAVPRSPPSLGLTHGHDKLELVHRSSSKRRPMSNRESLLQPQGQEASTATDSPPQNIVLAAQINNLQKRSTPTHRDSANHVYQAAPTNSKPEDGGQGIPTSVARQLFPSADGEQNGERSATSTLERSRRRKTVDTPVKTLGIASENTSPASSSVPAWIAMAKNKQMRSSLLLAEKEQNKKSTSLVSSPPMSVQTTTVLSYGGRQSTDSTIPKMGTVQARLAAFERK